MIVAVTGASGHVGGNLVRLLLEQGHKIRVLHHIDNRSFKGLDVEVFRGDILDKGSLFPIFRNVDIVFHAAALISLSMRDWKHLEAVNVCGTRNVVEACISCNVGRLVHFSSIHALSQEPLEIQIDESRKYVDFRGSPPYDRSKAHGEMEVLKGVDKGLDAVIIRPTGIIGPFDYKPSHTGRMLLSLAGGRLPALVKGGFDWVDVRDVVSSTLRAAIKAPSGSKYILSGHWVSLKDMAEVVERQTGVPSPLLILPVWVAEIGVPFITAFSKIVRREPLYTRVSLMAVKSNMSISHTKAASELNYSPRPFEKTISDTLEWFSKFNYI